MTVNDQMYDGMRRACAGPRTTTPASMLVFMPLMAAIIAGILFAIFNAALGGTATFKQVFAVVVHAGADRRLAQLFTGPLNYFARDDDERDQPLVLLPMLDEGRSSAGSPG